MSLVKPNRPRFCTLDELAAMVPDGARLSVGGHHFARLPLQLVRAVAARGPRDLRHFSWGGGLPLEIMLEAGAIAEIDLCFSSLDVFGLAPRFRKFAEDGTGPVRDWPALAMIQSLRARQQNLPFLPMQVPAGSDIMRRCPAMRLFRDPASGREVVLVEAAEIDVLLLHAPRADSMGNVEIYGAQALDLLQVGAARTVLVTVDEIVPAGALVANGRQSILLRNRISAIAEVPFGAYPSSSLPFHATDYERLHRLLQGELGMLCEGTALPAEGVPEDLRRAPGIPAAEIAPEAFLDGAAEDGPATIEEIVSVRIARLLDNNSFASAGAVSPLANVAYRLAKATFAPDLIVSTLSSGHLDIAPGVMTLTLLEAMDAETAVAHASGDGTYSEFYQGGYVTHEIVAAAQVDARCRINAISLTTPSGKTLRLPGQGGMADVANMHRDFVVYLPRHSPMALVTEVAEVSAARGLIDDAERVSAGYRPGDIWLITDLCVFRFDRKLDRLVVVELMPGVLPGQVVAATGFEVVFAEGCATVTLPTAEELWLLRRQIDPLGLRRLEFVSAKERTPLLEEIIARDRAGLNRLLDKS
jgi:glutaconate CoA-transferase subunit A